MTTDERKPLPDFVIVGAAKAATTSLFAYLSRHPQVFASPIKEPSFFSYWPDREMHKGFRDMVARYQERGGLIDENAAAADPPAQAWRRYLPAYESLFEEASVTQVRGEATTNYTRFPQVPDVPERMASVVPSARLIYIMRHPVDRAYSHFVHRHSKELYRGQPYRMTFDEFIEQEPVCVDSSRYMLQIEKLLAHFSQESILFLLLDDLTNDVAGVMRRVFQFLGIDANVDIMSGHGNKKYNVGQVFRETTVQDAMMSEWRISKPLHAVWRTLPRDMRKRVIGALARSRYGQRAREQLTPPPLTDETRKRLQNELRDEIKKLGAFLGKDLSAWSGSL